MAYDKQKLFKKAQATAKSKKCLFLEELVSYLPCSKSTFWNLFPSGSDELDSIKEIIEANVEQQKSGMYKKWYASNNATLQVSLMKLLGTEEQAHRLNGSSQKVQHSGEVNISPKEWV